jgi:hypothetical protein
MKRIQMFFRWAGLYILWILMIIGFVWEESLSLSTTDHTIFIIGLLVLFGISVNIWINHHPENMMVSPMYYKNFEKTEKNSELDSENQAQAEKTK